MKSAFGSKRKPRKIQVDEEDDIPITEVKTSAPLASTPLESPTISNFGRKAFKKSSLRQSINFDGISQNGPDGEIDGSQPVVNRASLARASSLKRKGVSSRLSFGPGEIISGDAAEALEEETFTPKKGLGRRAIEKTSLKSRPAQRISLQDEDESRPSYSRDYLNELKSSTPTTPKDLQSLEATSDIEGLDASELDGAMVVDLEAGVLTGATGAAYIPSEAEIREKKERRSRLAHEQDFISLNDTEGSGRAFDQQLSLLPRKKKIETRLVREDEDLGEGFDEFVEDGRISLGKKQEREAKRKQRKEMADMIQQAEGSSDGDSDDSDAEVRAAFEAAQTRAGMDGLLKPEERVNSMAAEIPSKITPLPVLSACLERLQATLSTMEQELAQRRKKMANLEQEKRDIAIREVEVQELLNQAGQRNSAQTDKSFVEHPELISEVPDGAIKDESIGQNPESFASTPAAKPEVVDLG